MIRSLLSMIFLALASPALALSCMPHDLAQTFAQAAQADETYIIVHGTLHFDESRLPKVDFDHQHETPPNTLIPAQLKGKFLSLEGFNTDFDRRITLNAQCFGPWCAGATSGISYLTFLQRTANGYVLALSPCGGFGFANPTPEMLGKATRCIRGEACKTQPLP